jgi:hypothetical protein
VHALTTCIQLAFYTLLLPISVPQSETEQSHYPLGDTSYLITGHMCSRVQQQWTPQCPHKMWTLPSRPPCSRKEMSPWALDLDGFCASVASHHVVISCHPHNTPREILVDPFILGDAYGSWRCMKIYEDLWSMSANEHLHQHTLPTLRPATPPLVSPLVARKEGWYPYFAAGQRAFSSLLMEVKLSLPSNRLVQRKGHLGHGN